MKELRYDPASVVQDQWVFGEFGGVNPSITDSSTYTFLNPDTMERAFHEEMEGCFLYSRHYNPINRYLCDALARMEATEAAQVTASGMAAISSAILQVCGSGDEVVSGWTIYGGTYALFSNFLPRFGIKVNFVDATNADAVAAAVTDKTKVVYCESISNPLLEVPDIEVLADIAHRHDAILIVDNTFSPMILMPALRGADAVVHSLTKFVNGSSDCVAGVVCASKEFIAQITDVNSGACMLLGPVLDSMRSASILKNLHTLHLRMIRHSENALFLARRFHELGLTVHYPGLEHHPQHDLMRQQSVTDYGFGGMLVLDVGDHETAGKLAVKLQEAKVGYLAVSLGYFKTLFSPPSSSTSSEIPPERQKEMGLSSGMMRFSIGLDNDIKRTWERTEQCLKDVGII